MLAITWSRAILSFAAYSLRQKLKALSWMAVFSWFALKTWLVLDTAAFVCLIAYLSRCLSLLEAPSYLFLEAALDLLILSWLPWRFELRECLKFLFDGFLRTLTGMVAIAGSCYSTTSLRGLLLPSLLGCTTTDLFLDSIWFFEELEFYWFYYLGLKGA